MVLYCKKCGYIHSDIHIPRLVDKGICPICRNKLDETRENRAYFQGRTEKAMPTWQDVVRNKYLKDINLDAEASNKRSNMEQKQQEEIQKLKNNSNTTNKDEYIPKCPNCGSTAITSSARGVNIVWGFIGASKTVNRCANCGHMWKPKK